MARTLKNAIKNPCVKPINVDIEIRNIPMSCIQPYQSEETAPFVTASFDIECDSSHGDFPNPCKDFKKLVIDIHESYFRLSISQNSLDFIINLINFLMSINFIKRFF